MRRSRLPLAGIVLAAAVFGTAFFVQHAHAQDTAGVQISPSFLEERVDPEQTFSTDLRITNRRNEAETFYLGVRKISGASVQGHPIFAPADEMPSALELPSWVSFDRSSLTLGPGETGTVRFTIQVPENAPPGGHFAGITIATDPPELREAGAAIGYTAISILALRVGGDIREDAFIREFRTEQAIYARPQVDFGVRIENTGNSLIRPQGIITISNMMGNEVASVTVNEDAVSVFPGNVRAFNTTWEGEGLGFGRYEAVLTIGYGAEARKSESAVVSFWILPMNLILGVAGGISGLLLLMFFALRLYVRRKLKEAYTAAEGVGMNGRLQPVAAGRAMPPRAYAGRRQLARLLTVALSLVGFTLLFLGGLFLFFA